VGTAAVVYLGARQVMAGTLSLGSLVIFISYLASLFTPIQGLSQLAGTLQRALVGAERVVDILDTPTTLAERVGAPPLPPVRGTVTLNHVTFGYDPDEPVLHDVDLVVSPGEIVALIGASGAGKTTIVSLLLSYYDPQAGAVGLDGHPLHRFDPDSCRHQVSAVLQEPMLFDASVAENIRYGRLDATNAEVFAASVVAQADDFIRALPQGYDTGVGPRGTRLSGGQRQRVAIARAVIKAAPVLVLDEATSALDPATEAQLLPELRRACAQSAVLLVAHRYSTVRHADRIESWSTGGSSRPAPPPHSWTVGAPTGGSPRAHAHWSLWATNKGESADSFSVLSATLSTPSVALVNCGDRGGRSPHQRWRRTHVTFRARSTAAASPSGGPPATPDQGTPQTPPGAASDRRPPAGGAGPEHRLLCAGPDLPGQRDLAATQCELGP